MKTKKNRKNIIKSLLCLLLAATFVLSDTAGVCAASNWKTVTLNSSCTNGITYKKYKTKSLMEVSEDGKSISCTYSPYKADGTLRKSIDLKSALPEEVLAKFKDGKVYLYKTFRFDDAICNNKAALARVKKKLKEAGVTDYYRVHYYNTGSNDKATKHKGNSCDGSYIYYTNIPLSDAKGTGKITSVPNTKEYVKYVVKYLESDGYDDYDYLHIYGSLFLADKDGNKIMDITFQQYTYDTEGVTCSLESLYNDSYSSDGDDFGIIVATPGTTLSEKISFTGETMAGKNYSTILYTSNLLTVKKDGTVKNGKYGKAIIEVIDENGDLTREYEIFITDGSKEMLAALKKQAKKSYWACTLTVGKNGKYTIKNFKPADL
jgi:hypothetical protein